MTRRPHNGDVNNTAERVVLLTLRVRRDPAFANNLFVSLRRYELAQDDPNEETAEVATIEDALAALEGWMRAML